MHIGVLGPLEVRSDAGDPVTVPGGKERLLLALLSAAAPGAVSVDRIMETLWNGDRPASARSSLQPYADWRDAPFAAVERRRLAEVRTGALTALLEARLARGAHAEVVA